MIGKPITASSVGLSPEIVVTAPALSTIDILKNSVIVQTYTLTGAETQHTFCVPMGTYVVRAPNGVETQSKTIAVDTVASYPIEFGSLKLYWDGDECTAITGGWSFPSLVNNKWNYLDGYSSSISKKNREKHSNYIELSGTGYDAHQFSVYTKNKINFNGYSKVCVSAERSTTLSIAQWMDIYSVIPAGISPWNNIESHQIPIGDLTTKFNLSSEEGYINFWINFWTGGGTTSFTQSLNIKKVWLEK